MPHLINLCTAPIYLWLLLLWNMQRQGRDRRIVTSGCAYISIIAAMMALCTLVFGPRPTTPNSLPPGLALLTSWMLGLVWVWRTPPGAEPPSHPGLTKTREDEG